MSAHLTRFRNLRLHPVLSGHADANGLSHEAVKLVEGERNGSFRLIMIIYTHTIFRL